MSKVWMVTGSSVGLGRAVVEAALAAGHRVIATARKVSTLDELAARHPDNLLALGLDVHCRPAWDAAVAAGVTRFGAIDVLVNNAGFGAVGPVENTPVEVVRRLLDTNLIGAVHACQAIIPTLRRQGHGHIILISSIGARIATPGAAFYYASKAAVSALAESLALEVGPLGIKVTAVEPGGMRTRFAESSSLTVSEPDPAYAKTVGATIAMMQSSEYRSYLGDPAGHAVMVLALAELESPPVRILAGIDAVMYGVQAGEHRAISDAQWKLLGQSATVQ
ncbi:SDR family NAD(P)-dependent oxidoreductase [Noviherbaspirillum pedocola]|uniref:SDR family NAD(P)-dependent oxidoreductase n=1 Tax=Noviherbaspirillum pedocola TaxID=2801341 RepID=A0A934WAA1_9BURK|nr:SDR family NAD(P)-dependent oxidoreductase [Noviherbaspirillum pedocola]MBK4738369.1 SDR family NAD(P)-dependent oxidoreductase [Noviherbaspirillum pedocola]